MKRKRESAIQQASSMALAMTVDWSELPNELLNLISQHIDNEIDLIRFRSICSNWRTSSIPNYHRDMLTLKFPLFQFPLNIDSVNNIIKFRNLTRYSFFLIKPPPQKGQQTHPFLIKISQNSNGKTQLLPTYSKYCQRVSSPLVFDFTKFSLLHLATNFMFRPHRRLSSWRQRHHFSPKKVIAVTSHGKKPILLGIYSSFKKEKPVVFKYGDENWKAIRHMSAYLGDICVFKGQPYAVDKAGRTVTVELGPDDQSTVELVAESLVAGGDIKFLVESKGDLLLVDVYNRKFDDDDIKRVKIDVFKLNEREKKWVKLANIGDRVLFLGSYWSFSASALELCVPKGNCVITMDNIFNCANCARFLLDLDDGRLLPFTDFAEYINLLFPPKEWIKNLN